MPLNVIPLMIVYLISYDKEEVEKTTNHALTSGSRPIKKLKKKSNMVKETTVEKLFNYKTK